MTAENTLVELSKYCKNLSGDTQVWQGKQATYHWNIGGHTAGGMVNGVVRKLAGIDVSGRQIWVVAGSFKIDADGSIIRFTGLPKKDQTLIARMGQIAVQASQLAKESEYDQFTA
jgi:hypothetical protein